SPDGEIRPQLQPCDDEVCWGIYDPAAGVLIGGQAFVGYAVKEDLHVGARVLGGYRFGGGYLLVGGPSGAMEVGDLWLGATLAFGGVAQAAPVTGVRGEIPEDSRQYNQDAVTKDVDTSGSTPLPETEIVSTWAFGATLEISYPIVDVPSGSWTSGALVVSAWPSFFKGLEGFAIAVPVTIGYRFY
ncbi:MAG: hypothetical protein IT372_23535, partial [Polyangiaceae bacterium]|nr:hypothetical protein [Polyangiaceae bacterium]